MRIYLRAWLVVVTENTLSWKVLAMRLLAYFIALLLLTRFSLAADQQNASSLAALTNTKAKTSDWIYISIGGLPIHTTKNSIKLSGMPFLISLLDERFSQQVDKDGYIPVDRPQADHPILDWYLRMHALPNSCNLEVAKEMANFYGGQDFLMLVEKMEEDTSLQQYNYESLTIALNNLFKRS